MSDFIERQIIAGINQTKKALSEDKVELLYMADDADWWIIEPVYQLAKEKDITIERIKTMKKLGKMLGVAKGASVGAVLKVK